MFKQKNQRKYWNYVYGSELDQKLNKMVGYAFAIYEKSFESKRHLCRLYYCLEII